VDITIETVPICTDVGSGVSFIELLRRNKFIVLQLVSSDLNEGGSFRPYSYKADALHVGDWQMRGIHYGVGGICDDVEKVIWDEVLAGST
jgi:hypothetical protein